jgi:hypothetical protein
MISPIKCRYANITDPEPETGRERLLQQTVREMEAREPVLKQRLAESQAGTIMSSSYCVRVKGQLAEKERGKEPSTKLVGDGLPIYMTSNDFFGRVEAHEEEVMEEEIDKEERRMLWEDCAVLVKEWKKDDDARKKRNAWVRMLHKGRVRNWEIERDTAKREGRKPVWTKPKCKKVEPPLRKPSQDVVEESDDEQGHSDSDSDDWGSVQGSDMEGSDSEDE